MADARKQEELADLFRRTARAHHEVFVDVEGEDPEWPMWYAHHLTDDLNELAGSDWSRSEVVHLLIVSDREYTIAGSPGDWPEYYAAYFLDEDDGGD